MKSSNRIKFLKYWVINHIRFFVFLHWILVCATIKLVENNVSTISWSRTINLTKCFYLFSDREQGLRKVSGFYCGTTLLTLLSLVSLWHLWALCDSCFFQIVSCRVKAALNKAVNSCVHTVYKWTLDLWRARFGTYSIGTSMRIFREHFASVCEANIQFYVGLNCLLCSVLDWEFLVLNNQIVAPHIFIIYLI